MPTNNEGYVNSLYLCEQCIVKESINPKTLLTLYLNALSEVIYEKKINISEDASSTLTQTIESMRKWINDNNNAKSNIFEDKLNKLKTFMMNINVSEKNEKIPLVNIIKINENRKIPIEYLKTILKEKKNIFELAFYISLLIDKLNRVIKETKEEKPDEYLKTLNAETFKDDKTFGDIIFVIYTNLKDNKIFDEFFKIEYFENVGIPEAVEHAQSTYSKWYTFLLSYPYKASKFIIILFKFFMDNRGTLAIISMIAAMAIARGGDFIVNSSANKVIAEGIKIPLLMAANITKKIVCSFLFNPWTIKLLAIDASMRLIGYIYSYISALFFEPAKATTEPAKATTEPAKNIITNNKIYNTFTSLKKEGYFNKATDKLNQFSDKLTSLIPVEFMKNIVDKLPENAKLFAGFTSDVASTIGSFFIKFAKSIGSVFGISENEMLVFAIKYLTWWFLNSIIKWVVGCGPDGTTLTCYGNTIEKMTNCERIIEVAKASQDKIQEVLDNFTKEFNITLSEMKTTITNGFVNIFTTGSVNIDIKHTETVKSILNTLTLGWVTSLDSEKMITEQVNSITYFLSLLNALKCNVTGWVMVNVGVIDATAVDQILNPRILDFSQMGVTVTGWVRWIVDAPGWWIWTGKSIGAIPKDMNYAVFVVGIVSIMTLQLGYNLYSAFKKVEESKKKGGYHRKRLKLHNKTKKIKKNKKTVRHIVVYKK